MLTGFGTGALAIIAACIAAFAASRNVARSKRLEEETYKAKQGAYKFRIQMLAGDLFREIEAIRYPMFMMETASKGATNNKIKFKAISLPEELKPENWEDHSLLDKNVIYLIHRCFKLMSYYEQFIFLNADALERDDPHDDSYGVLANHKMTLKRLNTCIEAYLGLMKEIADAAQILIKETA